MMRSIAATIAVNELNRMCRSATNGRTGSSWIRSRVE
ncbi:Uncharacterised protein [Mycobacterium tuberculosis]|uniref:Uncharacterized protein n=1 Tax=Mycobacterium tuberculosis TaxID=1773 RepID=A0A916L916_MYCTX|nr:Uncharacterised protein [Mycobacterium tuberculosis]COX28794.1 Uncharacterised protein [Mycobacterium tuberculosis]CPA61299.1 Uncharacterised protein [Mycobacterium tuberculosis]